MVHGTSYFLKYSRDLKIFKKNLISLKEFKFAYKPIFDKKNIFLKFL
jgi:hypothetical protein